MNTELNERVDEFIKTYDGYTSAAIVKELKAEIERLRYLNVEYRERIKELAKAKE